MTTIEADIANISPRLVGEPYLYPTRLLKVGRLDQGVLDLGCFKGISREKTLDDSIHEIQESIPKNK